MLCQMFLFSLILWCRTRHVLPLMNRRHHHHLNMKLMKIGRRRGKRGKPISSKNRYKYCICCLGSSARTRLL